MNFPGSRTPSSRTFRALFLAGAMGAVLFGSLLSSASTPTCASDADCDDGVPCTTDYCVAGTCRNYDNCGSDCDFCPPEACNLQTGACEPVDQSDPAEICGAKGASNCGVSNDPCAPQDCDVCGQLPTCHVDADCNDGNDCTQDICNHGVCDSLPVLDCCNSDSDCDDNILCTADSCVGHVCAFQPIPDCCVSNSDCDDGDACTSDSCTGGHCVQSAILGCCHSDQDCDDGNPCSQDACLGNQCAFETVPDCSSCQNDGDCHGGICQHGVCQGPEHCDDGDACTVDTLDPVTRTCSHAAKPGCTECGNSRCELGENRRNCPADCGDSPISGGLGGGGGCSLRP